MWLSWLSRAQGVRWVFLSRPSFFQFLHFSFVQFPVFTCALSSRAEKVAKLPSTRPSMRPSPRACKTGTQVKYSRPPKRNGFLWTPNFYSLSFSLSDQSDSLLVLRGTIIIYTLPQTGSHCPCPVVQSSQPDCPMFPRRHDSCNPSPPFSLFLSASSLPPVRVAQLPLSPTWLD